MSEARACVNPACPRPAMPYQLRCSPCRRYWQRHGVERPAGLPIRQPSGYAKGEPSECSPEAFDVWVRQACADHRLGPVELAAVLGVRYPQLDAWRSGQAKVPRWLVRRLRREGALATCSNPVCDRERAPGHSRCWTCLSYYRRHGSDRPAALCRRVPVVLQTLLGERCANPVCAMPRNVSKRRRRCDACDLYYRVHGAERPAHLARPAPRYCRVSGCHGRQRSLGLCQRHYDQGRRAPRATRERSA